VPYSGGLGFESESGDGIPYLRFTVISVRPMHIHYTETGHDHFVHILSASSFATIIPPFDAT
jgi:hypothetical protein